ncbi:hypothetical protein J1614_001646 [Plenodomus biglobosus]|nr:hypothetical protein J1614_001646 [Plenodomus biglobosus]
MLIGSICGYARGRRHPDTNGPSARHIASEEPFVIHTWQTFELRVYGRRKLRNLCYTFEINEGKFAVTSMALNLVPLLSFTLIGARPRL